MAGTDAQRRDRDGLVRRLEEFCAIPSHAGSTDGLRLCVNYLMDRLAQVGCQTVEIRSGYPAPILEAHLDRGTAATLLVYGMYDVRSSRAQVRDENSTRIQPVPGLGDCLLSRVPLGYKPSLELFLTAIEEVPTGSDACPNLILVLEGDEIQGSPQLQQCIEANATTLRRAKGVFWPRPMQDAEGRVDLYLGYKGMLGARLTCSGDAWGRGPSKGPVHSQHRVWVDAPAWHLVEALASLVSEDGNRIHLPTLARDVGLSPADLDLLKALARDFDNQSLRESLGVKQFLRGLSGLELLVHHATAPSVNLELEPALSDGVGSLQARAAARLQFRLPPEFRIADVVESLRRHLGSSGFDGIEMETRYAIDGARADPGSPVVRSMLEGYERQGIPVRLWPVGGATAPTVLFKNLLGIDFADGGPGRTFNVNGQECVPLDGTPAVAGVDQVVDFYQDFLRRFVRQATEPTVETSSEG